jgi:S1-C subfamily serine protease
VSRWGWRSLVAFTAGGLIAAAGFAAGEINDPDGQAAGPTPSSIVVQSGGASAGNVVVETGEPAAIVADRLGPSVVQVETDFGLGSGVIYRDGYVLTNNHVVDGAEWVKIRLSTGENFEAILVGTDESKDLAVLGVGDGRNLPVADLALDVEVRVGQIAVAIGSPFQLQQTVTAGIVSAVDRPVPSRTPGVVVAMIQTDAPINPGNSGGALADKNGRVIGINTAIQTDGFSGTNAGVGFAIPIDDAVRIADLLVSGDPIEPGFLGVTGDFPEDGAAGVEILEVTAGSAAEAAGLQPGDRVLSLDGAPVTQIEELAGLVLARQAGDRVTLQVVRGEQEIELDAVLGVRD